MKKICAWCKVDLGEVPSDNHPQDTITHGMCEDCATRLTADLSKPMYEFLDSLDAPVLLMESEPRVRTGNSRARSMLGKALPDIDGHLGGDVLECIHAKEPGGCGKQTCCKSCVIRNTVMETFATGKSHTNVPAYPDIEGLSADPAAKMLISTEKVGSLVMLRIDRMDKSPSGAGTIPQPP